MKQTRFSAMVWELATAIPEGRVTTYGILARRAGGGRQAARSVASVLSKAPNKAAIPFHRIVYADGRVWMTPECEKKRRALFRQEGIKLDKRGYIQNFEEVCYHFE
ncbi:MAG: MGMT family protein [Candidatus Marinimicrobia bacterium]|nr:MGMT family protein [Candidatus Neomarinimicrobiota bacterium]